MTLCIVLRGLDFDLTLLSLPPQFIDQCKAQFEDDNQYAVHVAPAEPEEPADAAGMMHSLAGRVAQSVSAAFFRPPVRSGSITSSRDRNDGADDEMAVAPSGYSTSPFSAHSVHSNASNMSDAERTMSALEAIRAEDRKKRLAEMNAAKSASPTPSSVNPGLQRSGSGAKGSGKIRFSEEGEVPQPLLSSSKKRESAKGSFRLGGGVKFNDDDVDLESGPSSSALKPQAPSRPQSARVRGGLKKVSVIGEDEVSKGETAAAENPAGQRKLFSFASKD